MKLFQSLFILFLPSRFKVWLLRKMGHKIHKSAHIGLSILNIQQIELGKNTYIGTGNIFKGISQLNMQTGSRINRWNYFTSSWNRKTYLVVGKRSSISMRHYFDMSDNITIGENTIIAGVRSTFITHSKGLEKIDYIKPIKIGDWCYIGSNTCFVPGASIGSNCFVGMGSVIAKDYSKSSFWLIAGNPALKKKKLASNNSYFSQHPLKHPHMLGKKNNLE